MEAFVIDSYLAGNPTETSLQAGQLIKVKKFFGSNCRLIIEVNLFFI